MAGVSVQIPLIQSSQRVLHRDEKLNFIEMNILLEVGGPFKMRFPEESLFVCFCVELETRLKTIFHWCPDEDDSIRQCTAHFTSPHVKCNYMFRILPDEGMPRSSSPALCQR